MKSISFLSLVLIFLLIVTSCKKDSEDAKDLTSRGLLTSHGWKYSSLEGFGQGALGTWLPPENCKLDDCYFFEPDGSYITKVGSIKCNSNEQDHYSTWVLSEDGHIISGGDTDSYTIIFSIETNKLVLKWEYNGWGVYTTYIPC